MVKETKSDSSDRSDDGDIELVSVINMTPEPVRDPLDDPLNEPYRPDSVYTSIDGLRSIAVFLMVVRTIIARFMYGANPLSKAFGGDWLPPVFLYASGARFVATFLPLILFVHFIIILCVYVLLYSLVAEQEGLRASLDALNDKPEARKRLLIESAVKYYASTIIVCFFFSPFLCCLLLFMDLYVCM